YHSAVDQRRIAADPDQPAPGPLADQGPELGLAESVWQVVAPGTGALVDEHHLGAVNGAARERQVIAFARPSGDIGPQRLAEVVDDVIGQLTAAVEALVNDDSLFLGLGEEVTVEPLESLGRRVRHINVSNAAPGQRIHLAAVSVYPGEIA